MSRIWKHRSILQLIQESDIKDPIAEIRRRARHLVIKALEAGWQGPPFSALELSRWLSYDITPSDSVLDARTIPKGRDGFLIEYNPFQKTTRINFSIAHEIAHTLFSDCHEMVRNRETEPAENRELEQLCNIGASEIQLPYAVFTSDANNIDSISLEALIDLASKYKASLESLFIRFIELTSHSCAVLICCFEDEKTLAIEYQIHSATFPKSVPDNFTIPKHSKAYDCSTPGWSARETVNWLPLREECCAYYIGISPMRKENRRRVAIILTPKRTNAQPHRKISMEFGDATKPRGNGVKIIAQVVNTSGGLGIGFGKSLAKNYPEVKPALDKWKESKDKFILGNSQLLYVGRDTYVYQMLAQKGLYSKGDEIPLKYSSLRKCLMDLYHVCVNHSASVHMPLIGAGQAKGKWEIIQGMIHDELSIKGIDVNIYVLPGSIPNLKFRSSLTSFKDDSTWLKKK